MKLVPYTNETANYVVIGNITIPPGQTRDVEDILHPEYQAEPESGPASTSTDIVDVLQRGPIAELLKCLPELSREDLDRMDTAEQQRKTPRKTVLAAISELQLANANQSLDQKPATQTDPEKQAE